jgi:hypothetical protein
MLKTGLEFAPGTTDDCKALVGKLFTPTDILASYRAARQTFKTGDIVLVASESDPSGFSAKKRMTFVKEMRDGLNGKPLPFIARALAERTAHAIMKLPFTSEAMWLVITRHQGIPVMVVIYATPYETTSASTPESDMVTLN